MHCMAVTLRHRDGIVTAVEPVMARVPWTTCPGAVEKLQETFVGQRLVEVTGRREKKLNCTHLHDMAVLAAAHADDAEELHYEVFASDPVDGTRHLEIRRNGAVVHRWVEQDGLLVSPADLAGQTLLGLRDWVATQPEPQQEAARLLQWASLVAHGRTMPMESQSDATAIPPNCFTFQPERAVNAVRTGRLRDFSVGPDRPLDGFAATILSSL